MTEQPYEHVAQFVARLGHLDAGGLAVLRRSAGQQLAEARRSYSVFFSVLPQGVVWPATQEAYFLIATLYSLTTRGSDERRTNVGRSLGLALHTMRQEQLAALGARQEDRVSLDRRVAALLDADAEQLPFRLRQIVRLLHSRGQALDWTRLLHDLLRWGHPDRFVQRRWAREYYVGTADDPLNTQKESKS